MTANTFEASSITLGSHDPILDMMSDATLNLYESLAVKQVEHVDFYLQSYIPGQYSSINIADSKTLMLDSANNINIYLGEDLMGFSLYAFDIIAGDVTGLEGITFSIFDGTKSGEDALLWSFVMEEGYMDYQSLATVTTHYFEVKYTENGVTLVARIPNLVVPEPTTASLSLMVLSMMLLRRRRQS